MMSVGEENNEMAVPAGGEHPIDGYDSTMKWVGWIDDPDRMRHPVNDRVRVVCLVR